MAVRPWPEIPEEQRWALELMEERLEHTDQTPEELLARADELRTQAAESEIRGVREASLALADRYVEAASARLAAR